jgi:hypothetical protein
MEKVADSILQGELVKLHLGIQPPVRPSGEILECLDSEDKKHIIDLTQTPHPTILLSLRFGVLGPRFIFPFVMTWCA